MIRYVYNKEIFVSNDEPYLLDLYTGDSNLSWFAIYWLNDRVEEWHVKAININEAVGAFLIEHSDATYDEIIDHIRLDRESK